jgi:hypothetical protein
MRSSTASTSTASTLVREQAYQDYLRIMQTARMQAQRARAEAVSAFWCSVGQVFRRAFSLPVMPKRCSSSQV